MGVTATGHVFHESNVAGSKHLPGAITGANLDFAGKMNDQPAFGKRVEVPLSGTVKLLHPDLVYIGQCAQCRVLLQTQFLDMAFTVAPRKHSIYSHSAPPHSIARLLRSGLRLVRQTIESAQNALACHNEGIVTNGVSRLQTELSHREGHEARRIGLEAMPVDQHIEGRHTEREPGVEIRPHAVHD